MAYEVRPVSREMLPRILEIYAYARNFMARTGNPNQWGKTNPPQKTLEADIKAGKLYGVWEGEQLRGVFFFSLGEDPTYREIFEGAWGNDAPYGTIHRVASDGSGGVFSACLAFCREICPHIRIDTHRDNRVMQHVLEKRGFARRGIIYLENGDPRIAYELG